MSDSDMRDDEQQRRGEGPHGLEGDLVPDRVVRVGDGGLHGVQRQGVRHDLLDIIKQDPRGGRRRVSRIGERVLGAQPAQRSAHSARVAPVDDDRTRQEAVVATAR